MARQARSSVFTLRGPFKRLGGPERPNGPMAGVPCKRVNARRTQRLALRSLTSQRHSPTPPPAWWGQGAGSSSAGAAGRSRQVLGERAGDSWGLDPVKPFSFELDYPGDKAVLQMGKEN